MLAGQSDPLMISQKWLQIITKMVMQPERKNVYTSSSQIIL